MINVSIHAPAKGATIYDAGDIPNYTPFQFTLPRRERPAETARPSDRRSGFQFTVPRRERLTVLSSRFFNTPFQFTLPRRERHCRMRYYRCCTVSIHAPAKGATRKVRNVTLTYIGFNSRSREGSDSIAVIFL